MRYQTLQVGSFAVNCTIVESDGLALIVDPGQEPERIMSVLRRSGLEPAGILLTHGHFDHINAIPGLLAEFPELPVLVSADELAVLVHPLNAIPPEYNPVRIPSGNLRHDRDSFLAAVSGFRRREPGFRFTVIPTPGHTPGGVSYLFDGTSSGGIPTLLSGDTLFAGSVGRTDLPGGDMAVLMRSLGTLKKLPPETTVIPGHGAATTIAAELRENPFLQ